MRRKTLVKFRAAVALTKHHPQRREGFEVGLGSRIGDRLVAVCSRDWWIRTLRHLRARNTTGLRFRSRILLVLPSLLCC